MFEYQMSRLAEQHTEKLQREAANVRLARELTPRIATRAASTLRTWANRLDKGATGASAAISSVTAGPRGRQPATQ